MPSPNVESGHRVRTHSLARESVYGISVLRRGGESDNEKRECGQTVKGAYAYSRNGRGAGMFAAAKVGLRWPRRERDSNQGRLISVLGDRG
jgi:hypothetical protein